jgi:C_GCAxxG_C_C family probable redox protein
MTIEEAIVKTRPPRPLIPCDQAAHKAVEYFMAQDYFYNDIPLLNQCASQVLRILAEVWGLPCQDKLEWMVMGLQGGVCAGEICGTLSGAAVALGLNAWEKIEPRTGYTRRLAAIGVLAHQEDLVYAFRRKFGEVRCEEIVGLRGASLDEVIKWHRLRLWSQTCEPLVEFVVRTLCEWGESARELPPVNPVWRRALQKP